MLGSKSNTPVCQILAIQCKAWSQLCQVQSNALAALEAIDKDIADKIMSQGCITGDRINGLVDGETGKWYAIPAALAASPHAQVFTTSVITPSLLFLRYVKFDTFHPAVERGLPVTRVISRVVLQQILADAAKKMAGEDVIINDAEIVDYEHEVRHPCVAPLAATFTARC